MKMTIIITILSAFILTFTACKKNEKHTFIHIAVFSAVDETSGEPINVAITQSPDSSDNITTAVMNELNYNGSNRVTWISHTGHGSLSLSATGYESITVPDEAITIISGNQTRGGAIGTTIIKMKPIKIQEKP